MTLFFSTCRIISGGDEVEVVTSVRTMVDPYKIGIGGAGVIEDDDATMGVNTAMGMKVIGSTMSILNADQVVLRETNSLASSTPRNRVRTV